MFSADKFTPVAITVSADIDLVAGTGTEFAPLARGRIFRGKDKGKYFSYTDVDYNFETLGINVSVGIEGYVWFYTGDIDNFSINSFNGESYEIEIGYGSVNTGVTWTKPDYWGARLIGVKYEYSSPSALSIYGFTFNYGHGITTVH